MAILKYRSPIASLLILVLTLSLACLSSCSGKKKSSTVAPQYNSYQNPYLNSVNINPHPTDWNSGGNGFLWNFEYYFYDTQAACSTGRHSFQGYDRRELKNAVCQELQNAEINNHNCAEQQRRQLFRKYGCCRLRCCNYNSYFSYRTNVQVKRENMPGQDQGQQMPPHQNVSQESRGNSIRQW